MEAKRRNCLYWSQLPPDLILSVLERLSITDLQRAKSVCSSWHSASRNCFPKSQIPWLIIFPQDDDDDLNRCKLFNPDEKDKIYTSRDLGVGFAEDVCVTTYGSYPLWREVPGCSFCRNMVYKHQKLYVFRNYKIHIFDLSSGELPLIATEIDVYDVSFSVDHSHVVKETKLVVTVSGDVLMVTMSRKTCSFCIYKMSSTSNEWDLGVTVNAKDVEGIRKNSIYFSGLVNDDASDVFIYDLKTEKIERLHQSVCSLLPYSHARWFFPCFSLKNRS